jgi:hypothetical protein
VPPSTPSAGSTVGSAGLLVHHDFGHYRREAELEARIAAWFASKRGRHGKGCGEKDSDPLLTGFVSLGIDSGRSVGYGRLTYESEGVRDD